MLTDEEYVSMQEFCAGSKSIKDGIVKQQIVADLQKRGLSLSECTILINRDCLQKGRNTITRSAVRTCALNMVRMISNIESRLQGNKNAGSMWTKARYRWVAQLWFDSAWTPT